MDRERELASVTVTSASDALFVPDGERFIPTELTRGGWSETAQHGGPPCGLMAHVIETAEAPVPMQVARITFDLLRPVPLTPLTVRCEVVRPGRRIQVVQAVMEAEGLEVARALALMIRNADVELPEPSLDWIQPPPPGDAHPLELQQWAAGQTHLPRFHLDAIEIRTFNDSFYRPGRGVSWFRLRYDVVAEHETTPLMQVATLADLSNGNSMMLDPRMFLYVNPDVTLYVHRLPNDEWLGMDSIAYQHASGIGVADSLIFDPSGPLGRVTQAQLIERHGPQRP